MQILLLGVGSEVYQADFAVQAKPEVIGEKKGLKKNQIELEVLKLLCVIMTLL